MTTGDRLRFEREKKGWTQLQAAEILGISNAALSNYERDVRQPDYEMLRRFARIFGTSTDYLLGHSGVRKPSAMNSETILDTRESAIFVPVYELPLDPESPFNKKGQIAAFPLISGSEQENYFYVKIPESNQSLAKIDAGDVLLCKKQEQIDSGALMLAQTASEPVIIARFYEDHHRFIILGDNSLQPPMILQKKDVRIYGRIVAALHYFK